MTIYIFYVFFWPKDMVDFVHSLESHVGQALPADSFLFSGSCELNMVENEMREWEVIFSRTLRRLLTNRIRCGQLNIVIGNVQMNTNGFFVIVKYASIIYQVLKIYRVLAQCILSNMLLNRGLSLSAILLLFLQILL